MFSDCGLSILFYAYSTGNDNDDDDDNNDKVNQNSFEILQ